MRRARPWRPRGRGGPRRRLASPSLLATLGEMIAAEQAEAFEDAEIVCDDGVCMVGDRYVEEDVMAALLKLMAVSDDSGQGDGSRFVVNDLGRALHRRPDLEFEIMAAVMHGTAVTIVDDRLVPI